MLTSCCSRFFDIADYRNLLADKKSSPGPSSLSSESLSVGPADLQWCLSEKRSFANC